MQTMTVPGTEKQIEELSKRVDFGFEQTNQRLGRVEDDLRELRAEMNVGFHHGDDQLTLNRTETKVGFDGVRGEFGRVGDGFGKVNHEFTAVRGEMKSGFEKVDEEFTAVRAEMKAGFEKVDEEFTAVRGEMKSGFEKVDEEFTAVRAEMKAGFEKVDREFVAVRGEMKAGFDGLQRQMTRFFAGTLGSIIAAVVVSAILSHL
jgi:hypothetical protein